MGRIYNKTKRAVLAGDFELASSTLARARGLMFRCGIRRPILFVFNKGRERTRTSCAIHSLFVSFPFSAIFLDKNKKVIDARTCSPFVSFVVPKADAAYLIEGKPGLAGKVRVGDVLEFKVR